MVQPVSSDARRSLIMGVAPMAPITSLWSTMSRLSQFHSQIRGPQDNPQDGWVFWDLALLIMFGDDGDLL
jgi:hypothetical protein